MNLEELLDCIIDGVGCLVNNKKIYSAAMLSSMCIEIMGRIKSEKPDFLTSEEDAASLFRNALKQVDGLKDYNKLIFNSKDYPKVDDLDATRMIQELKSLKERRKIARTEFKSIDSQVKELERKLYERLREIGLKQEKSFDLYYALRCGFAHNCLPGENLALTDDLPEHPYGVNDSKQEIVLGVKNLYDNLKKAQESLKENTRMAEQVLYVYDAPVYWLNRGNGQKTELGNFTVSACGEFRKPED
jgi:hypothetical protein